MCKSENLEIELKQEDWNNLYRGKNASELLRQITGHDIDFNYNNDYGGVYYTGILDGKVIEVVVLYPNKLRLRY